LELGCAVFPRHNMNPTVGLSKISIFVNSFFLWAFNVFNALRTRLLVSPVSASQTVVYSELPRHSSVSRTLMTEMLRSEHTDSRGLAYGGSILAWVDVCAGVSAKRHSGKPCVTASVDGVHFFSPVKLGDIVVLRGAVNRAWRTSLEVEVRVEAEDMLTGKKRYCCQAYLTFVAVENGNPVPVP
ncbi:hypothetical protein HK096_009845, partial [Nowakowskiella sp. JEL0078]